MRFSTFCIAAALFSSAFAAPIKQERGLEDVFGALGDAIKDPKLTLSRVEVATGLGQTMSALKDVANDAQTSGNTDITPLANDAMTGVGAAQDGVKNILGAIFSGTKPKLDDQKSVAQGIAKAQIAIGGMAAAATTPDASLTKDIQRAQSGIEKAAKGGKGVLESQNLTFADVGLNEDGTVILNA